MEKRLECSVHGRVQGVMYRDFVRRTARKLDITGTVQNNEDGTVTVIAEGQENKLKDLLAKLHQGPALAQVEQVKETWSEATGEYSSFRIIL